ncbi:hypothetical protein Aperf_G00000078695 [Anoplocephala perfoliata]
MQDFWNESSINEGWNHAHEFPPHITLLSNLRVSDDKVLQFHRIYDRILQGNSHLLKFDHIPLKLVTSDDFIGYIVSSDKVNTNLEKICHLFLQELLKAGIIFDDNPTRRCKSNYHMSLAYGFQSSNKMALGELQDTYDGKNQVSAFWTLDLFSGDFRLSTPDSELYEMRTTLEVDDLLFSNLALEENLCSSSEVVDNLSSPASSPGPGRTPNSDCLQISFQVPFNEMSDPSSSESPSTLAHSAGEKILLIGSCNLRGRYGAPVGLNVNSGLTGVFSLASAHRIPKWYAWVTHRSTVVIGRQADSLTTELCNTFVAPSRIPASFSSSADFFEPLAILETEGSVTSPCLAVGAALATSNNSALGGTSFHSKLLSRNSRRKSIPPSTSFASPSCSTSGFQTPFVPISSSSSSSTSIFGSRFFGSLLTGAPGGSGCATSQLQQQSQKPHRRLYVMRHAERMDICFGRAWTTRCIDRKGIYHRLNLNMPARLPVREDIIDHTLDSPLTQVGLFVAGACGRALTESGIRFAVCYASPALRCVQTACQLLQAAGQGNLAVRIEPLLFEWLGWYSGKLPKFLSPKALHELGYNVDTSYHSISSLDQIDLQESVPQFYVRSTQIVKDILDRNPIKGVNILIVAHAASLDSCTRSLLRKRFRSGGSCSSSSNSSSGTAGGLANGTSGNAVNSSGVGGGGMNEIEDLHRRCALVPYCGLLCAVEGSRKWHLEEPPIPSLIHGQNADFDWRQFHGTSICSFGIK